MTTPGTTIALLLLRLATGAIFIAHGAQKIFIFTLPGTQGAFADMGAPLPEVTGPFVAYLELVGGILLILGLFTRVVALLLAVDMLVALVLVHLPAGIFVAEGGYEFVLLLAATSLALVVAGPGAASLDQAIFGRSDSAAGRFLTGRTAATAE